MIKVIYTLSRKRNYSYLLLAFALLACNSEDANNCLQTDGDTINFTVELPTFTRIQMEDDIRVILREGSDRNR